MKATSIKTKRFLLKPLHEIDASDRYLDWFQQHDIKRYIMHIPNEKNDLVRYIQDNNNNPYALLLGIFDLVHQQHIGNIRFEFSDENYTTATMGIMIGDESWRGKKVAPEVIRAGAYYLHKTLATSTIKLGVEKSNHRAIKAYQNIGFTIEAEIANDNPQKRGFLMAWNLFGPQKNKQGN